MVEPGNEHTRAFASQVPDERDQGAKDPLCTEIDDSDRRWDTRQVIALGARKHEIGAKSAVAESSRKVQHYALSPASLEGWKEEGQPLAGVRGHYGESVDGFAEGRLATSAERSVR